MTFSSRTVARCAFGALVLVAGAAGPGAAQDPASPQPASPNAASRGPGATGTTTFLVENMTRVEAWRYFAPRPGGGVEPDYTFLGNRSTLGASYRGSRWTLDGRLQYVRVENLPAGAIGPGLLGTGGAYYFQAAGTFSYQFYLRSLSLGWRNGAGVWAEVGRLSRAPSSEPSAGDAAVDRLVASDLNGRLAGDMEWSFYQRAWDGLRGGLRRGRVAATITAVLPTQGTFEESANLFMDRVRIGLAEVTVAPGRGTPHTRLEWFGATYHDSRAITARPDNSGRPATRADVRVQTAGAALVGAYPSHTGESDVVVWTAVQRGRWYELAHRGLAATVTIGHRLGRVPARPWLRAGAAYASGDGDGTDGRHGTFFPMLPSGDRVSALNAYARMNVVELWTALELSPSRAVDLRAGVRRVRLASGADRWYQGSGATIRSGNYFGYQGRNARGATSLGTVVEAGGEWRPWRWWTLRAFAGRLLGGDVPAQLFGGRRLTTGWLESTVRF